MGKALDGSEHHTGVRCCLHQAGVVRKETEGPALLYTWAPPSGLSHYWSDTCVLVAQSCLTHHDPVDCSSPGSSVHGVFLANPISYSRGSFWPRDRTRISCIADRFFTIWDTREALIKYINAMKNAHCGNLRKYHQVLPIETIPIYEFNSHHLSSIQKL